MPFVEQMITAVRPAQKASTSRDTRTQELSVTPYDMSKKEFKAMFNTIGAAFPPGMFVLFIANLINRKRWQAFEPEEVEAVARALGILREVTRIIGWVRPEWQDVYEILQTDQTA